MGASEPGQVIELFAKYWNSQDRDDIALTHNRWSLQYPGRSDPMQGETAEVVRRQPDGGWRYAIDNPAGGAVIP